MKRLLPCALLVSVLALCGCAARPAPGVLTPVPAAAACARQVTIYVATTRTPDAKYDTSFTSGRSPTLNLARYTIAIPPNHKPANIEWPRANQLNPASSFAVSSFTQLSPEAFLAALANPGPDEAPRPDNGTLPEAAATPVSATPLDNGAVQTGGAVQALATAQDNGLEQHGKTARPRVGIFVHGYNTNFPEALYRIAQLAADNPDPSRTVLFSWPSDGTLSGYVADKDAAAFSRDQMAAFLMLLTADARLGSINLAAHSMGCWLTMETLRQLRLSHQDQVLDRLGSVILAAPDIDLDVFRSQIEVIGPLEPPLTVLASPDDRALYFSNRLGGERERVGSLDARDPRIQTLAKAENFQLIDISGMSATDSLNHDRFVGAAASLQKLLAPKTTENPLRKVGAFVLDAAASVLEVPGRLGRAAAEGAK